jgi:hypothetical protein
MRIYVMTTLLQETLNMEKNLQNNVSERTKVGVRFPNESFFEEIEINIVNFKPDKHFSDEIFGWYNGTYISIKK